MKISFEEFIQQEKNRLERFEHWWIEMNKDYPDDFPMHMMSGNWTEQLTMFED